jgi:glycosyltransferase 2 family protein
MPNRNLKKWSQAVGYIFGAVALYVFFAYFFDWNKTKSLLSSAKVLPVCLAAFFFVVTLFLRAFKWTFILRRRDYIKWSTGYYTVMLSTMVNFLFPIRFGEILKLYIVKKVANIRYSSSVSATLVDRCSQMLSLLVFLLFTPVAGFVFSQWASKFVIVFAAFVVVSMSLFVFGIRLFDILANLLEACLLLLRIDGDRTKAFWQGKLISFLRETLEKINISQFSVQDIFFIALFSFVIFAIDGLCYYFIIKAFGISITWLQGTLAACFMQLIFVLPSPPGQVGTAEMYPVLIFSLGLGLDAAIISAAAILWHLITSVIFMVLGLFSASALGMDLRSISGMIWEETSKDKSGNLN